MTLYTTLQSAGAHRVGTDAESRGKVPEYDAAHGNSHLSVYSAHCAPPLIYSAGQCAGCRHIYSGERDLVNGYCDVCRACGANERQCVNTGLIGRSEQGRVNSATSMWRTKYKSKRATR